MGPTPPDNRMSEFESLMWTLDADARLSSTVANLTLLDRPPDPVRLAHRLREATRAVPRLRQRVAATPLGLAPPNWIDDDHFDLDRHVRTVRLRNAGRRQLLDRAMELFEEPFDRRHPLWEFVVIEGLRGGRAAMLQRIHHTLTDGEGGLRISLEFIDLERDVPIDDVDAVDDASPGGGGLLGAVAHLARGAGDGTRRVAGEAVGRIIHPTRGIAELRAAVDASSSALRQVRLRDRRLSPLWTSRSFRHRFDLLDVDLEACRSAARALGGTVNDLFVTAVAGAAGDYHRAKGVAVEELRMAMPISTRRGEQGASNRFSPSQTRVPAGALDPFERFRAVQAVLAATRAEPAIHATEALAAVLNLLPTPVVRGAGVRAAETVDFVTSNLRAAPFDVYMGGALIEGNYPIGPLATTAFNVTMMSYRGTLNLGLVSDTGAIDDPELLVRGISRGFRSLFRAADGRR